MSTPTKPRKPLRLWPGVVLAIAMLLARFVLPVVAPQYMQYGVIAGPVGGLLILLWWLLFSRAAWKERLGALVLMVAAIAGTRLIMHESIRTGAMGMLFYILVIPGLAVAFVAWAVATRGLPDPTRRWTMAAAIVLACAAWALIRTGGFTNEFQHDFAWRWSPTPEERLIATEKDAPPPPPAVAQQAAEPSPAATTAPPATPPPTAGAEKPKEAPAAPAADTMATPPPAASETKAAAAWPGFRGPHRDGIVSGVQIRTDWSAAPPVQIWKRPVGPGWSSFAVQGDRFYTQEQRGEDEVVSCYKVSTGQPVWRHTDRARFWESNAGAGPRGTPTLAGGRVYTFGGTGIVNVLDADTGAKVWSRNAATDTAPRRRAGASPARRWSWATRSWWPPRATSSPTTPPTGTREGTDRRPAPATALRI
jgi:outer membrane protein assembly factor BamB